ncbi:efflux RND transporter periplasmic adaptor subunit [Nitratifractor salsuginis]|uniref:Secretion protein HlyD family protein n=1 Tax=Nitratifractor salsuginis (strain DSM 16511 / JCM 12458 / E9I37-1) TaxID=749222 RepID=E6WZU7_NITSE|nr:efflux RND transporter periplasmic adaptor subunit [Nitratifractor salsuginis]ADV45605.1 secretion protein HlyD family protein [Nitratifractor salsuginis DSM 16511]
MKKIILTVLAIAGTLFSGELELSGTVISDNQKMITSRFMGFVKDMNVSEGDRVKKGQVLYEIDSKEIEAAVKQVDLAISQARLALQMNENQLNNVLLNLARNKRLLQKDMVSKFEVEQLELAAKNMRDMVEIAKKQVEQAEAQKESVLNQYKYLTIKAPNDGVVVAKRLNEGDMQIPGMPALVITDLRHLKVLVQISESNLKHIRIGKKVKVEIPSIGFQTEGKISAIIPASNPMTHKFKIKITFDKKNANVFPGMYAKVYIPEEDK